MSIAFFDLDKTLIADNSAKLWLKEQWRTRQISLPQMLNASYWLAKYHLGFTQMEEVIKKSLLLLTGENKKTILKITKNFFNTSVKDIYRPGALIALDKHREAGDKLCLLTSSFDGLALLVQKDLALDYCLCTRLEADKQGFYTGNTIGPPCFGKNKLTLAHELCDSLNISLANATFYTDSASDLPLLKVVGRAVAVNPDPHLRAKAQLKRWEIVDWGRPAWIKAHNK